jgi:hypothetical protein
MVAIVLKIVFKIRLVFSLKSSQPTVEHSVRVQVIQFVFQVLPGCTITLLLPLSQSRLLRRHYSFFLQTLSPTLPYMYAWTRYLLLYFTCSGAQCPRSGLAATWCKPLPYKWEGDRVWSLLERVTSNRNSNLLSKSELRRTTGKPTHPLYPQASWAAT